MLHQHLEKYSETGDTAEVDGAVAQFKEDKENRNKELLEFIDDFVNCEEYQQYLQHKKRIKKRNVAVQHSLRDLNVRETLIEDKYPLTTKSRKMFAFLRHFERYTKNKENAEILKRQEKGINIIKEKMKQYKKLYTSTRHKMYEKKENEENKILEEFCESLNVDTSTIRPRPREKIRDAIVCYQKIKHSRNLKTRTNIMDIVRKLTEEYKRKKQIDKTLNKTYLYKVKRKEKILKDMKIVGQKIVLKPKAAVKDEATQILEDLPSELPQEPPKIEQKGAKDKKSKKSSEKSDKRDREKEKPTQKKKKEVKEKKDKQSKKDKKKQKDELIIPPIPKCNLRLKIGLEDYGKMLELLTYFDHLDDMIEDQYILAQKRIEEDNRYDNRNFLFKPDVLLFQHFDPGKIYKKKLRILNTSPEIQKIRILETTFTDPYDSLFFKILPLFGIQKLAKGCYLDLTIIFSPIEESKQIEGKLVFVGYGRNTLKYERCFVAIRCVPPFYDLKIEPAHVQFGKIAIWRAYGPNYKTVKLINNGSKPFEAIIKKVSHPLDLYSTAINKKPSYYQFSRAENHFIKSFLNECLENVFSNFQFESYYTRLGGMDEKKLSIKLRNVSHVGNYFEKYNLNIYESSEDNSNLYSGCQEISISAETTDYFIKISPDTLDFGVCILNSIYQLHFDVYNDSSITQVIILRFPSNLVEHIKTDVANLYIPRHEKRSIWLKFLPRKTLFDTDMYYDKETAILEFPIQICVINKTYQDIPPIKATVFAILTAQKCLAIAPVRKEDSSECVLLNLGICSVYETVTADIELTNNTLAPQIYGFNNIPQCVTIKPNYGFGEIMPNERKILKLQFSPDFRDVTDNFEMEGDDFENVKNFRINVETENNTKRFGKVADVMLKELKNQGDIDLVHDIEICAYYIKINMFSTDVNGEGNFDDGAEDSLREEYVVNKKDDDTLCVTHLWVRVKIVKPLLEFSHQYIEFPDTPCGSCSFMQVELRALNIEYLLKKYKRHVNYTASFRIYGGSNEIRIEPTCGVLKKGEIIKIYLIVIPNTPDDIIRNTARNLKYSEVYEEKQKEYELTEQKQSGATSKKEKKGKKNKKKDEEEQIKTKNTKNEKKTKKANTDTKKENDVKKKVLGKRSDPTDDFGSEKDLKLDYLDLYPAQMYYWRNLQPYVIKTIFTCTIHYEFENMVRKPDNLYLNAVCKVVKPDFITNLKLQRIDFGQVVMGMSKSEPVIIQNIHYDFIKPEFSLLSPVGPFSIPYMKDVRIPPEHFLEIPLVFEPNGEGPFEEYFEISSGKTMLPLILQGNSVPPDIDISPQYLVCRLQAHQDSVIQFPIEIKNKTETEITIVINKVFELEGMIKEVVKDIQDKKIEDDQADVGGKKKDKANKSEKQSNASKGGKKGKENKSKKIGEEKFSDELSEAEEASFSTFTKKTGGFCYDTINIERNKIYMAPESTAVIKIGFGLPNVLLERKQEELRKLADKQTGKGKADKEAKGKGGKKSDSTKGSKKEKDIKGGKLKPLPENQIYHVTKYNIMLNKTFLKDFILISTFI